VADYLLIGAAFATLALLGLLAWRALAGPSGTGRAFAVRTLVVAPVALVLVAAGAYQLMGSRSLQLAGEHVRRVDTAERVVALTFDDGPTPEHTGEVLEVLAAHDARATFYLTGGESDDNPEELQAIVAAGHELGNHTWSHRRLVLVSGATVADEIERTDAILRAAGYDGPITFRPPGCKRLLTAPLYLASHGRTTVTWDLEPDSIPEVAGDADAIVTYVTERVRPGSIVLLHVMYDSRAASRAALPRILERLAADGYRFVTVSELLALR
jgi:peptidoglycan/xylan/chitin deacetylase (PgdA/CDA1 family)